VKTIVKKVIRLETKRHDFDNDFAYLEVWRNNTLKDCYFAEKQYLWPDGSIKRGGIKYFYSPLHGEEIEKEIKSVRLDKFDWFDRLFYLDGDGTVHQIDCDNANISPSSEDGGID
jgi:hypothetical protein|tara:strand:- start:3855 stop:4199 length:345 start_codon:yes stop_codon:yes gene_type:complete